MVWKKVLNSDAGDATHFGGNDLDKVASLFSATLDVDTVDINSSLTMRSSKFKIRNPANTFGYTVVASAITASRNITIPGLTADDSFLFKDFAATIQNKIINNTNSVSGYLDFTAIAEPTSPSVGKVRVFIDLADGHVKAKKNNGDVVDLESEIGGGVTDLPIPLRTIEVTPAEGWNGIVAALNAAVPGDEILVHDGTYSDKIVYNLSNKSGTSANQIVVRSETVGGVTIVGTGTLKFNTCAYVTWYGFTMRNAADTLYAIRYDASCVNCRFARNDVQLTGSIASYWLSIGNGGSNMRIDHNNFHDKTSDNAFLNIIHGASLTVTNTIIENNYFKNKTGLGEAVVLGLSTASQLFFNSIFRNNLLEGYNVPTDGEIISVKSCGNIIDHNSFINNVNGVTTLRHGTNNSYTRNYCDGSGGVIVSGSNHIVMRNQFKNLTSSMTASWMCAIGIRDASTTDPQTGADYAQVNGCKVAMNTIINGALAFTKPLVRWGMKHPGTASTALKPINCIFQGNIVQSSSAKVFAFEDATSDGGVATVAGIAVSGVNMCKQNYLHATSSALPIDTGLTVTTHYTNADPQVTVGSDGMYRINSGSPGRNLIPVDTFDPYINSDIDGELTENVTNDIGCDQYSTVAITSLPLKVVTISTVGPASP